MMKYLSKISLILICCLISSSYVPALNIRLKNAQNISKINGFTKKIVKGRDFWLTTFQKITNKNLPYVFYLEGDGLAFTKYGVSENPTPAYQLVLKLAAKDTRPNVVYIARPCQYTPMNLNPKCNLVYWTNSRMSEEVVSSMNEVIKSITQGQKFSLVGYSGGGGVAILIAARNNYTKDILTIAGNLDHISFNQYHKKRPMIGSLNPIDYASSLSNIPQLHISGRKDDIVPDFIVDKYVSASNSTCVHHKIFSLISHQSGWERIWREIMTIPIVCYGK